MAIIKTTKKNYCQKKKKKKDMAKMLAYNLAKTVNLEVGTFF